MLSLTPLPVDLGNLYAENVSWGIGYTAAELSLMAPMMWVAGTHMGHGGSAARAWSDAERNAMITLLSGYVLVKLAAAVHAGYAAQDFNRSAGDTGSATLELRRGAVIAQLGGSF